MNNQVQQTRKQRRAIVKANQSGLTFEPVTHAPIRNGWDAIDRKASPYAAPKALSHHRVGYLSREAMTHERL